MYVCISEQMCVYVCSVLQKGIIVVVGFNIAFSAVYVSSVSVANIKFVLSEW